MIALAHKVIECCRTLAGFTEEPGRITRTFLSPPMHDVHRHLRTWMESMRMEVRVDAAGNLRGVRRGGKAGRLVIGSHLDTVPNAGAFDGILGVVMGVALVEVSGDAALPTIEVIGFSEEEGVRFGVPFIGSRAVVGELNPTAEMTEAIRLFGLDPGEIPAARLSSDTNAYLEFHIEQGPVLESLGLQLGIVDAIVGQSRFIVTFEGKANHAGTTPMSLRKDALISAASWILDVERVAKNTPGLVATTGRIVVEPNAANVIPGKVSVSLDVRHARDDIRQSVVRELIGLAASFEQRLDQAVVPLDEGLRGKLANAVRGAGHPVHHMTSGAGHDAMIIAPHIPSAMLFLRSPGGISHHPDEDVVPEDVAAALETGLEFLRNV